MKSVWPLLLVAMVVLGVAAPAGDASASPILQVPSMGPCQGLHSEGAFAVADDFISDGVAIVGVTWWGAYWLDPGAQGGSLGEPLADSPGTVSQFVISIWTDTPSGHGVSPWAHPGETVYQKILPLGENGWAESSEGAIDRGDGKTQTVFKYEAAFVSELILDAGETFWLSIQAIDEQGDATYWCWQESADHWNGNALQLGSSHGGPSDWWYVVPGADMAFSFDSIVSVPLPASLLLLGSGLALVHIFNRHRRHSL